MKTIICVSILLVLSGCADYDVSGEKVNAAASACKERGGVVSMHKRLFKFNTQQGWNWVVCGNNSAVNLDEYVVEGK